MKTRLITILVLLILIAVLFLRNDERIHSIILDFINPMKQNYTRFTHDLKDKSKSYLFQKESIERLSHENKILRKRLLEQIHYLQQIKTVYHALPKLSKLPMKNVSMTDTISYIKLNSFSKIILTKPFGLKPEQRYGLIQNKVVGGVAQVKNNQLYGYLTSDTQCQFSVFIGSQNAPGIAIGKSTNTMIVKFIPKWHKINIGDKVITSGLDNIFFTNIPVGIVTKVEIKSSYKVAYIQTYCDTYHPKMFFLIHQPKVTLTENFDINSTYLTPFKLFEKNNKEDNLSKEDNTSITQEENQTEIRISSIPSRIDQTKEDVIELPIPVESHPIEKTKKKSITKTKAKVKQKTKPKIKQKTTTSDLDFF